MTRLALPACVVIQAIVVWLVFAMASAEPATGRSADGRCTITQTPSLWVYLGVWGLALLSCVTLLVAVLATRRVVAVHRTGARIAAVDRHRDDRGGHPAQRGPRTGPAQRRCHPAPGHLPQPVTRVAPGQTSWHSRARRATCWLSPPPSVRQLC
jgi:hypothetical protein